MSLGHRRDVLHAVVHEEHLPLAVQLAEDGLADAAGRRSGRPRCGWPGGPCGGVVSELMSRRPSSAMCSVRGIGVAVIVSTSTVARRLLRCSLCSTPNRCSSSMITSPRSAKRTSLLSSRCVPMRMSISPARQPLDDLRLLAGGAEPADHVDLERVIRHPLAERPQVLVGQHGRRHEHRHLPAGLDRLERRPHRQLRLAVAHVAAQQAVHRRRRGACPRRSAASSRSGRASRCRGTRRRTVAASPSSADS